MPSDKPSHDETGQGWAIYESDLISSMCAQCSTRMLFRKPIQPNADKVWLLSRAKALHLYLANVPSFFDWNGIPAISEQLAHASCMMRRVHQAVQPIGVDCQESGPVAGFALDTPGLVLQFRGYAVALVDLREASHRGGIIGQLMEQCRKGFLGRDDLCACGLIKSLDALERMTRHPGGNLQFGGESRGRVHDRKLNREPASPWVTAGPDFLQELIDQFSCSPGVSLGIFYQVSAA